MDLERKEQGVEWGEVRLSEVYTDRKRSGSGLCQGQEGDTTCLGKGLGSVRCTCYKDCWFLWSREWGPREHAGGKGTAHGWCRNPGEVRWWPDEVGGRENGERSVRDVWEVRSARLFPATSLAKIILICSTICVNEIISRHPHTPPYSPTVDWFRLFLVFL